MTLKPVEGGGGEYRLTRDPQEVLCTSSLEACVGVALFQQPARCLIHLFYSGSGREDFDNADKTLPQSLSFFTNPQAIVVAVPFLYDGKENHNPLGDFVVQRLKESGVEILQTDFEETFQIPGNRDSPKEIYTKVLILADKKAKVLYYDRRGTWINHPGKEIFL